MSFLSNKGKLNSENFCCGGPTLFESQAATGPDNA